MYTIFGSARICALRSQRVKGGTFATLANSRVCDKLDPCLGVSAVKDENIRVVQFLIGSLKKA